MQPVLEKAVTDTNTLPMHGGDLDAANARYGTPAVGWLDLSTGINQTAYPIGNVPSETWQSLPSRSALDRTLAAARNAYAAKPDTPIVAAPGAQAIIQVLPQLRRNARVAIVGPTYSEHARAWANAGARVSAITEVDLHAADNVDVVVVVNPNNPTGRSWPTAPLLMLARVLAERDGLLIVDESFADAMPSRQLTRHCGQRGLLVMRSFGKFYGLAGLRLGFALGHQTEINRLRDLLGPWAVSGPALAIAEQALSDTEWANNMKARLNADSQNLAMLLEAEAFELIGQTPLFVTAAHAAASSIHADLARAGIWTRAFDYAPDWLRFGVPDTAGLARLHAALDVAPATAKLSMRESPTGNDPVL